MGTPVIYVGAGDSNSGLHACVASTNWVILSTLSSSLGIGSNEFPLIARGHPLPCLGPWDIFFSLSDCRTCECFPLRTWRQLINFTLLLNNSLSLVKLHFQVILCLHPSICGKVRKDGYLFKIHALNVKYSEASSTVISKLTPPVLSRTSRHSR